MLFLSKKYIMFENCATFKDKSLTITPTLNRFQFSYFTQGDKKG